MAKNVSSTEACGIHCKNNEKCIYYSYFGNSKECYMQALETEVAEPVSIENCGEKCVEDVYSVPSSAFEINFREKNAS